MTRTTPTTHAARGQVSASAAEIYEAFFVPALFGQFVEPVLDHAGVGQGDTVLDVGCGTGILARAARHRVGPTSRVAAVDPNVDMLAVARRGAPTVEWHEGVAEQLPFGEGAFDHTVSQFAAMFFADAATALGEMARVTVEGGTVTIVVWADLDRTPGYRAMVELVADELGAEAADALRAPFALGDVDEVRDLVAPLGRELRVDEIDGTARFASIADWVRTDVRGWTLDDLVDDDAEVRLVARCERDLARFVTPAGLVEFPAVALVVTSEVDRRDPLRW